MSPSSTTLRLRGILAGPKSAAELRATLESEIARGPKRFVVDLSEVSALDDEALRTLVAAAAAIEQSRGELVISGARDTVDSLMRLTRVDRRLRVLGGRPGTGE